MDFTLTEEHLQAQKMVRDYAQKEIAPIIKEADRSQTMNANILPRMGELGILGICIPAKYGGQGFDYLTLALVCEELEVMDTSLRVIMSVHMGLNSMALLQWGTEEQKMKFLKPQAEGKKYAMFGLTEPGVGSDVVNMASTAKRDGGDYVINGEKMWISLATKAHHILWVARTNPERPDPHDQLSAFIVETSWPGVECTHRLEFMGLKGIENGVIRFDKVKVPRANLI
ncbi:MAG: acyl-CoA dehydrogenase family protein, partial [Chloroflexota bacterium]